MKKNAVWALKPGERFDPNTLMNKVIEMYYEEHGEENVIVVNDVDDIIYFIHMDSEDKMHAANVAFFHNDTYIFIPAEKAFELAKVYLLHIDLVAETYEYLDEAYDGQ